MPTVCLASTDIASQFKDLRKSFNLLGYDVITYVHKIPNSPFITKDVYDYVGDNYLPILFQKLIISKGYIGRISNFLVRYIRPFFIRKIINNLIDECDLFIFLSSSFYQNFKDLEKIKNKNKKIVFIFCGDDARWYFSMEQDFNAHGLVPISYEKDYSYSTRALNFRLKAIRYAEKYADFIFSKREQSQLQIRPFFHFPMTVFYEDFPKNIIHQREIPIVLHAPTSPNIKGTKYVLDAFEELKKEGIPFQPILLTNFPNDQILNKIADADIVIDQLLIPGGGRLSTEALSMGKVVLSNMSYNIYNQGINLNDCPIIDVSPSTIYETLKKLILDVNSRILISKKGKLYVEKYLDTLTLAKKIDSLVKTNNLLPDYYPSFFLEKFIPESRNALKLYKKWTNFVKNENWFISSIQRINNSKIFFK